MGGRFKREGTYVHLWLIHVDVRQKTAFCKAVILQLKKKEKKNKEATLQCRGPGFNPWSRNEDPSCHGTTGPTSHSRASTQHLEVRPPQRDPSCCS